MSTDLAPFRQESLSARLQRSCARLDGWDTTDEDLPILPTADAKCALGLVEPECEPAAFADLMAELGRLSAVTASSKAGDTDTMLASTRVLAAALSEYPASAAIEAVREWPKTPGGKWWPTENEIREEAYARSERLFRLRDHLRRNADLHGPRDGPRRESPFGFTKSFVEEIEAIRGKPYVRFWLSAVTCQFAERTVWTSDLGVERLTQECGAIANKHGVSIRVDADSRRHFREATARFAK